MTTKYTWEDDSGYKGDTGKGWNHLYLTKDGLSGTIRDWREGGSFNPITIQQILSGDDGLVNGVLFYWCDSSKTKEQVLEEIKKAAKELAG